MILARCCVGQGNLLGAEVPVSARARRQHRQWDEVSGVCSAAICDGQACRAPIVGHSMEALVTSAPKRPVWPDVRKCWVGSMSETAH